MITREEILVAGSERLDTYGRNLGLRRTHLESEGAFRDRLLKAFESAWGVWITKPLHGGAPRWAQLDGEGRVAASLEEAQRLCAFLVGQLPTHGFEVRPLEKKSAAAPAEGNSADARNRPARETTANSVALRIREAIRAGRQARVRLKYARHFGNAIGLFTRESAPDLEDPGTCVLLVIKWDDGTKSEVEATVGGIEDSLDLDSCPVDAAPPADLTQPVAHSPRDATIGAFELVWALFVTHPNVVAICDRVRDLPRTIVRMRAWQVEVALREECIAQAEAIWRMRLACVFQRARERDGEPWPARVQRLP